MMDTLFAALAGGWLFGALICMVILYIGVVAFAIRLLFRGPRR
ncbi:hypothetical protein [Terrihabitans sp. B22-R8]